MVRALAALLLVVLLVAPAAAQIFAEVGETYIRWEWPTTYGNDTLVLVDGIEQGTAAAGIYYQTDLNPNEEHQLVLINTTSGATAMMCGCVVSQRLTTTSRHLPTGCREQGPRRWPGSRRGRARRARGPRGRGRE